MTTSIETPSKTTTLTLMVFERRIGSITFDSTGPREECDVMLLEKESARLVISEEDLIEVVNKKTYKGFNYRSKILIGILDNRDNVTVLGMCNLSYDKIGKEGYLNLHVDSDNKRLLSDFFIIPRFMQLHQYLTRFIEPANENDGEYWSLDIQVVPYYSINHLNNLYID